MSGKFKTIKKEVIYSGRIVHLEKLKMRAPNGKIVHRELIRHGGAAVIIPVLKNGDLVLVYQHRVAVDGWIYEFPAGTLEKNEKPKLCAYRETIEETGYEPGKLEKLVEFYPAPGISTEKMHLYLATQLKPAPCKLDDDEFLKVKIFSKKELQKKIKSGEIIDGKTIIGFFYYLEYLKKRS